MVPSLWLRTGRLFNAQYEPSGGIIPLVQSLFTNHEIRWSQEKLSPSFICFEYDHPGRDGIRLLAETGTHYPGVPLVMLTNDHSKDTMVLAYRSGASSYLVKPIALHELVREIRTVLALPRDHARSPAGPLATGLPSQPEGAGTRGPDGTVSRTAAALIRVAQGFAEDLR
ncbi:MAG: response regulator, partial [Gammaproteobacteria bacterium]